MATTRLTIDGFPFSGTTPGGGTARLKDLQGWLTRTVRRERPERTGRHGSTPGPGLDAAKSVTVKAQITYRTAAAAAVERLQLAALGGPGQVPMIVTDAAGTTRGMVTVDLVTPAPIHAQLLEVSALVVVDSGRVHSTIPTTTPLGANSSVFLETAGTAAADLLVTVTTAGTVVLSAGGQTLRTGLLPVGAVIDTARATVETGAGVDLFSSAPVKPGSQFPSLPKGGGPVTQAGTAALLVTHFDTYA